jgi:CRISPR system Cascade subunit CasD
MGDLLLLRLEGPLQAWGDVAFDPVRPTRAFPSRSGLAGLLASALGWTYRDADRTTALQDSLHLAVREDRPSQRLRDYQTVDLGRPGMQQSWTRWGVEGRGGQFSTGTHQLFKDYLADGALLVALALAESAPVGTEALEAALRHPARPLFLGRKGCPPAMPIWAGRRAADTPYELLCRQPVDPHNRALLDRAGIRELRCWYEPGQGPPHELSQETTVWDRRDFAAQRFGGFRTVVEGRIPVTTLPREAV